MTKIQKTLFCIGIFLITFSSGFNLQNVTAKEYYKTASTASMLIIRENEEKEEEICLQLRENTGWMDGCWDTAVTGHVKKGESLKKAAIRECKEEADIDVTEDDLEFVCLNHNNLEIVGDHYCIYFKIKKFDGEIKIGEPDKCADIKWFKIKSLPLNIVPMHKPAIESYLNGNLYNQLNW